MKLMFEEELKPQLFFLGGNEKRCDSAIKQ